MTGVTSSTQPRPARAAVTGGARGAAVCSLAASLPATVVTNAEIADRLGVTEHWIVKRMGIRRRRMLKPSERLTDMAVAAGTTALERAGLAPEELDLVLVGTSTADELLPNAAPLVATALGATHAGACDVGAGCAGFLYALTLAAAHVETARADNVLVVGAEAPSKVLDRDDRRTAAIMGDGAGAMVVTATDGDARIGPALLRCDGGYADLAYIKRDEALFRMEGGETFAIAVGCLATVTEELLESTSLELDDVDLFVYHQANGRILKAVSERLGLGPEQVADCIAETGNTSAASIPLALDAARAAGRLPDGSRVLLATIGTGFIWGACLVDWDTR
jgi:3-oxoacyl-[acyl-carrier-protein] synthase III